MMGLISGDLGIVMLQNKDNSIRRPPVIVVKNIFNALSDALSRFRVKKVLVTVIVRN
jgi:hypothetical protein